MRYYLRGKAGPLGDSLKAVVQRVIVLKKNKLKILKILYRIGYGRRGLFQLNSVLISLTYLLIQKQVHIRHQCHMIQIRIRYRDIQNHLVDHLCMLVF